MPGLIIAAPASGSGKTTITLGLLRLLRREGIAVRSAKSGPDYIDPRFHAAASGTECLNLDAWAMTPDRIRALAAGDAPLIVEGAMGLFDGAPPDGKGAVSDLARILGLPVILVVDAAKMAGSVMPLVSGFAQHDPDVRIAGVILNNVGSDRHERMLRRALETGPPVLGAVKRNAALHQPSRHLGLVQAGEREDLDAFLDRAANVMAAAVNLPGLLEVIEAAAPLSPRDTSRLAPPAQRIAVASDPAFAFHYPHMMADWRAAGAEIALFSPLADEAVPDSEFVFLPGGYPELFAQTLFNAKAFMQSIRSAAKTFEIYCECVGYMVLGDAITTADGDRVPMAGLLRLETSFAARKLHLGYRNLQSSRTSLAGRWKGHEFHYATTLRAEGTPLFDATDAEGTKLPPMGLVEGRVSGSFAHLIDRAQA